MTEQTQSEKINALSTQLDELSETLRDAEEAGNELPNVEGKINTIAEAIEALVEEVGDALEE